MTRPCLPLLMLVGLCVPSLASAMVPVVCTTSIIADWVKHVGGDDVALTTLVNVDGDAHEYQPVADDNIAISQAALVFDNGLGLEPWLAKLCEASGTHARVVAVTAGVNVRHVAPPEVGGEGGSDVDPHAWQDVKNAVIAVKEIARALAAADPPHAADYNKRAIEYIASLDSLDAFVLSTIHSIPAERRKLVTSHDAFGYFARRYGIQVIGSALESITTEAADPSAMQLANVIDQVKAAKVPVIFVENIQNPRLIQQIATEAGVTVGPPLYSDALGPAGSAGESYEKMMRYNADALARALRP